MTRTKLLITISAIVFIPWFIWTWGFCRFYIEPGQMAVITAKSGKTLPPGQILADKGQKGVRKEVLGEGRHFLNPIMFSREIMRMITIPAGKVGIVTSKVGADLPPGEFLAQPDQKGIWQKVLGPGKYRMNPYGYQIDIVDAISIPVGYAGVVTSLSGQQAVTGQFAEKGQKGVRKDILQPGLYYINPKEFKIDILEVGINQVSLLGRTGGEIITKSQMASQNAPMEELDNKMLEKQTRKRMDYVSENVQSFRVPAASTASGSKKARTTQVEGSKLQQMADTEEPMLGLSEYVEFPSRDGFNISLDMTVEIELMPNNIAWIFSQYGDLPALVDKVIMPQITSISRNKGSEYGAQDFIMGEGREKFQNELTRALATVLGLKQVVVHNALIRHVEVPMQILDPIQQASIAIEQNLTNKEKQNTAKKLAELNTEQTLIDQRRQQVGQETEKIRAEIKADQEKQVAEIKAGTEKGVAEIAKETAGISANTIRKLSQAGASALKMTEGEKANGLQLKAKAFDDPSAYTLHELANKLNTNVLINIIHAGQGTLWTDMEKAKASDLGGAVILQQQQNEKRK